MTNITNDDEEWHRSLVETHSLFYDGEVDSNTWEEEL